MPDALTTAALVGAMANAARLASDAHLAASNKTGVFHMGEYHRDMARAALAALVQASAMDAAALYRADGHTGLDELPRVAALLRALAGACDGE